MFVILSIVIVRWVFLNVEGCKVENMWIDVKLDILFGVFRVKGMVEWSGSFFCLRDYEVFLEVNNGIGYIRFLIYEKGDFVGLLNWDMVICKF